MRVNIPERMLALGESANCCVGVNIPAPTKRRYWWGNRKHAFRQETNGGYMLDTPAVCSVIWNLNRLTILMGRFPENIALKRLALKQVHSRLF